MMQIARARTVLSAVAFVWVMLAWHYHEYTSNHERAYIIGLITRSCAATHPDSQADRDQCEVIFRTRLSSRPAAADVITSRRG